MGVIDDSEKIPLGTIRSCKMGVLPNKTLDTSRSLFNHRLPIKE